MPALGVVDDAQHVADLGEGDTVDLTEGALVLSLHIHGSLFPGPFRKDRLFRLVFWRYERATGAGDHESPEALQGTRGLQLCPLCNLPKPGILNRLGPV